jgi:CxxC motif-containing protein
MTDADPRTDPDPYTDDRRVTGYLCIGCPLGCRLEVEEGDHGEIVEVRGFSCRKGRDFAVAEHTHPTRMVTTTVAVQGGRWARLPVRTVDPVPKDQVAALCTALRTVTVRAPVRLGDVIVADALGTGVDVVASRDLPEVAHRAAAAADSA